MWPLASNLATAGKRVSSGLEYRCIVVGGAGVEKLTATLRKANEQSRWAARPGANGLVPGDCAAAAPGRAALPLSAIVLGGRLPAFGVHDEAGEIAIASSASPPRAAER